MKLRKASTGNVLASDLDAVDDVTVSVDLSAATRCNALITATVGDVTFESQVSPDPFDTADGSASWFTFFRPSSSPTVTVSGSRSIALPQTSDGFEAVANLDPRCGRRMRLKVTALAAGAKMTSCTFTSDRVLG